MSDEKISYTITLAPKIGDKKSLILDSTRPKILVGADSNCDLIFEDCGLAPLHALFRLKKNTLTLHMLAETGAGQIGQFPLVKGKIYILQEKDTVKLGGGLHINTSINDPLDDSEENLTLTYMGQEGASAQEKNKGATSLQESSEVLEKSKEEDFQEFQFNKQATPALEIGPDENSNTSLPSFPSSTEVPLEKSHDDIDSHTESRLLAEKEEFTNKETEGATRIELEIDEELLDGITDDEEDQSNLKSDATTAPKSESITLSKILLGVFGKKKPIPDDVKKITESLNRSETEDKNKGEESVGKKKFSFMANKRAKQSKEKKLNLGQKKSLTPPEDIELPLAGIVGRLFATILDVLIFFFIWTNESAHKLLHELIIPLFTPITNAILGLEKKIKQLLPFEKIPVLDIPTTDIFSSLLTEFHITVLLSFLFIQVMASLFFGISLGGFLLGMTNRGSFILKRARGAVRMLLTPLSFLLILPEASLIIGKRTLREFILGDRVYYRSKIFRFIGIAIFFLALILFLLLPILKEQFSSDLPSSQFKSEEIRLDLSAEKVFPVNHLNLAFLIESKESFVALPYFENEELVGGQLINIENSKIIQWRFPSHQIDLYDLINNSLPKNPFAAFFYPELSRVSSETQINQIITAELNKVFKLGEDLNSFRYDRVLMNHGPFIRPARELLNGISSQMRGRDNLMWLSRSATTDMGLSPLFFIPSREHIQAVYLDSMTPTHYSFLTTDPYFINLIKSALPLSDRNLQRHLHSAENHPYFNAFTLIDHLHALQDKAPLPPALSTALLNYYKQSSLKLIERESPALEEVLQSLNQALTMLQDESKNNDFLSAFESLIEGLQESDLTKIENITLSEDLEEEDLFYW